MTPSTAPPSLHADERGTLSMASLFAILGLAVGFALVANIGKAVTTKIESQNAADASAYAASVELARGMNAVTAANHLIGELQALTVLHHAFGGDELDSGDDPEGTPPGLATALTLAHTAAQIASPGPIGYDDVSKDCKVGGSIRAASLTLKAVMTAAYLLHALGEVIKAIPIVGPPIGEAIIAAAMIVEGKVLQEWITLNTILVKMAELAREPKKLIETLVIPGLYTYSCTVAGVVPGQTIRVPGGAVLKAEEAANDLLPKHDCDGSLYPSAKLQLALRVLTLPVTPEPKQLNNETHSQLVRVSAPWVEHWRYPWYIFGEVALTLSRFACHYKEWTNNDTLLLAERAKRRSGPQGINLLVMDGLDLNGGGKTEEPWAKAGGSAEVDRLFTVVAFARRRPIGTAALGPFRRTNPDGFVTYAQSLFYNANPQRPGSGGKHQVEAGWDTLNWESRVLEHPGKIGQNLFCSCPDPGEPRIKLNWRAKLVPTTRLAEASLLQTNEVGTVFRRMPPVLPSQVDTH